MGGRTLGKIPWWLGRRRECQMWVMADLMTDGGTSVADGGGCLGTRYS